MENSYAHKGEVGQNSAAGSNESWFKPLLRRRVFWVLLVVFILMLLVETIYDNRCTFSNPERFCEIRHFPIEFAYWFLTFGMLGAAAGLPWGSLGSASVVYGVARWIGSLLAQIYWVVKLPETQPFNFSPLSIAGFLPFMAFFLFFAAVLRFATRAQPRPVRVKPAIITALVFGLTTSLFWVVALSVVKIFDPGSAGSVWAMYDDLWAISTLVDIVLAALALVWFSRLERAQE